MIPKKIKVLKPFRLRGTGGNTFGYDVKQGEIGRYFDDSDVYLFESRYGYVPYIDREFALSRKLWFKPYGGMML